jgi:hypothetical protein
MYHVRYQKPWLRLQFQVHGSPPGACDLTAGISTANKSRKQVSQASPTSPGGWRPLMSVTAMVNTKMLVVLTCHKEAEGSFHGFVPTGLADLHIHICRMGPAPPGVPEGRRPYLGPAWRARSGVTMNRSQRKNTQGSAL